MGFKIMAMKKELCGYIAMYKGKQIELYTDKGSYGAQLEAARIFKAKNSYEVNVYLCEVQDKEIYQCGF